MPGHFLNSLCSAFADRGVRPAVVYRGRSCSYSELDSRARNCASRLQGLGVGKGDRVALLTANKLAFLVGHLGILYAGGISLPLNHRYTRDELRFFLKDSGARMAVAAPENRLLLEGLRAHAPDLQAIVSDAEIWDAP